MPSIDTLEEDLKMLGTSAIVPTEQQLTSLGVNVALKLERAMKSRETARPPNTLYVSEVGTKCKRQLWYKVNDPHLAEPMPHNTLFKFFYGDLIEETVLAMARLAGHDVQLKQHSVVGHYKGWEIRGRIDAIIDGVLVDVKSCSPFGFKKFEEGLDFYNDSFGYIPQLEIYKSLMSHSQPIVRSGFLAIDKVNGHIGWFENKQVINVERAVRRAVEAVDQAQPRGEFEAKEQSPTSPNKVLGTVCSYCAFKKDCWKSSNGGDGLRTFIYSSGPVFMTNVVKKPNVPEVM
jgi:hypothetical protein